MLVTSVVVKVIGAVYKIPLTAYIGAVGRGYFAAAYNLCLPIHAITMGAFPVALSHLVSKYNASDNRYMMSSLKKASSKLFFIVGLVGMGVMLALAVPYSRLIVGAPKSIYTILVLAPSILFSSMVASYRGYYEGLMNMVPTSVAQSVDAFSKMIFGLMFAKLSMNYLLQQYELTGRVLGAYASNQQQALSLIYPITSACAMLGATLGALISLIYISVYASFNATEKCICDKSMIKSSSRELLSLAFPIMISSAVQSVFQFLDTATIQFSLGKIPVEELKLHYNDCLKLVNISDNDLTTYLYGLFNSALDFKNLVPGITMALGICAVPAISREFELKNKLQLERLSNDILKYTMVLSCFAGVGLALCSKEIMVMFYGKASPDIAVGSELLVKCFGLTVPVYCVAGTAVFSVQAIGKPEKSILPYIVSGIIRVALNVLLVVKSKYMMLGAVYSGFFGYLVMCVWNVAILVKETKIKVKFNNFLIKPIFISAATYYFSNFLYANIKNGGVLLVNLLIKTVIFVAIFCILCFSLNLLNFREFFYHSKRQKNGLNT